MFPKSNKTRKSRARNGRRGPNNANNTQALTSIGYVARSVRQIVPDRLRTTLCYTATSAYSGSPTGGNVFVGNSMYDPDYAVGGQQPVGYDELSALYYRYRVLGSRIRVRFTPAVASTSPFFCCVFPTTDSTTVPTARLASQQPYAKDLVVLGQNPTRVTISNQIATAVIAGEPYEKVLYDDIFSALTGASPLSPWYWIACMESTDGVTNISGMLVIEIHYDAEFYRRKVLPQS